MTLFMNIHVLCIAVKKARLAGSPGMSVNNFTSLIDRFPNLFIYAKP